MLLTPSLLLALLALEPSEQPASETTNDEKNDATASEPASESSETSEPETADPSSDPELDVPALDATVLPAEPQGDLDSLNPPEPTPEEAPEDQENSDPKEASEAQTSTPPEKAEQDSEFRYQSAQAPKESYVWADASKSEASYRYADASSSANPSDPPYAFAPSQDSASSETVLNPPRFLRAEHKARRDSKQRFGLHFKLGPYLPDIDEGDAQGPYAKIFGEVNNANVVTKAPAQKLIYWLGFEWQLYHLAGPLSVGLDLGFFTNSADARLQSPTQPGQTPVDPQAPALTTSADKNRFSFVPISLLAGYRFSYLADKTPIPLVPYARAGLSYNFWWAQHSAGNLVRDPEGTKVRGGTVGWQGQFGLALRLDGVFRQAGRHLDYRFGINHVSLFGEFAISKSGLGGKKVNLGDNTFYGGLLLEF